MINWILFVLGTLFIILGLFVCFASIYGNYKFKYVCNRMQATAMQDTLGLLSILLGLICYNGFNFVSLKLLLVVVFFWVSSPVCSHLIVRMEATTNSKIDEEMEVITR
jgi:multicomponent Na+:H+ antiporter subunit G